MEDKNLQPGREEPEVYQSVPNQKSKEVEPNPEQVSIELPSGLKIMIGSSTYTADQLCHLVLQLKEHFDNGNITKPQTSYTG